jgi:hypothetical protein
MTVVLAKLIYPPAYLPVVAREFTEDLSVETIGIEEASYQIRLTAKRPGTGADNLIERFFNRFLELTVTGQFG